MLHSEKKQTTHSIHDAGLSRSVSGRDSFVRASKTSRVMTHAKMKMQSAANDTMNR